jgi:hypothetical protein
MVNPKPKVTRTASHYMAKLARRANAKLRGSEAAKIRSAKGIAAQRQKRAERKET